MSLLRALRTTMQPAAGVVVAETLVVEEDGAAVVLEEDGVTEVAEEGA